MPFYVAGTLAEQVTGIGVGKPEALRKAFFVLGNAVAGALTVWLTFLFALRLGGSARAAAATALTLAFATLLWPYAKMGFNAPRRRPGADLGHVRRVGRRADAPSRHVVVGGRGAWMHRARAPRTDSRNRACRDLHPAGSARGDLRRAMRLVIPVAVPVAAAIAITLSYNYVRFANPLDTGYLRDGTTTFGPALDRPHRDLSEPWPGAVPVLAGDAPELPGAGRPVAP